MNIARQDEDLTLSALQGYMILSHIAMLKAKAKRK